ncbi:MAG: TIGR00366 family protein [Planctomycetota bacterium]
MLVPLGRRVSAFFRATAPDPFVIAILLTLVTLIASWVLTPTSPVELVRAWGNDGLWRFLGFGMQMCLILVTGYALADSPPLAAALRRLARIPSNARGGAAMVALVAGLLGVLSWGLGLIAGAIMAKRTADELEKRGVHAHRPILAAAGYVGLMVWHGGFSGTAPLKVSTAAEIADVLPESMSIDPIPLTQTVLSPMNLVVTGGLLVLAPLVLAFLVPKESAETELLGTPTPPRADPEAQDFEPKPRGLLPLLLEDTRTLNLVLAGLIGVWAFGFYLPSEGPSGLLTLTPNSMNLTMLMLGLLLHPSPRSYVRAIDDAARGCSGIILQFPLYAGIMAMMHLSGLTDMLARTMTEIASPTTLPALTCLSAGAANLFVPSGGGQWGVQGPIAVQSGLEAGVPISKMVMAVAYGDQLTNMLQPFWALPLLAITRVRAAEIVGYTAILMVFGFAWTLLWLLVL